MAEFQSDPALIEVLSSGEGLLFAASGDAFISVQAGGFPGEQTYVSSPPAYISVTVGGIASVGAQNSDWLWGSKIGRIDFTLDESNAAWRMPKRAVGQVLQMAQLGRQVMVYSSEGVDALRPAEGSVLWGIDHLSDVGLSWKGGFVDTPQGHFYVDSRSHLIQATEQGIRDHDCSKHLIGKQWLLTWDKSAELVYLSSRIFGWVFNPETRSFGIGYPNLSGLGTDQAVGPFAIKRPLFEIVTGPLEFGSRSAKTLQSIEFSTNVPAALEAAIDMRWDFEMPWRRTPWRRVCRSGEAFIKAYGVEFRICLRCYSDVAVQLDSIKVVGTIHGYRFAVNPVGWAPNSSSGGGANG